MKIVSTQEQNTAVDGWNEQISQLTAECDQLKDSLQEINKVLVSTVQFIFYFSSFQPANFKLQGKCVIVKTLQTLNIVPLAYCHADTKRHKVNLHWNEMDSEPAKISNRCSQQLDTIASKPLCVFSERL